MSEIYHRVRYRVPGVWHMQTGPPTTLEAAERVSVALRAVQHVSGVTIVRVTEEVIG